MSTLQIAITILGMGLITYSIRLSFFLFVDFVEMPPWLLSALRYVPVAVLTAIIVPELLYPNGALDVSFGNERLLAGLLSILVAWRTRNMLLTIAVGMGALWLLQILLPS